MNVPRFAKVVLEYVDLAPLEKPWGYRVLFRDHSLLVDKTLEVASSIHAKVFSEEIVDSWSFKRLIHWIPARDIDRVEEYLTAEGKIVSAGDLFYAHPLPSDDGKDSFC